MPEKRGSMDGIAGHTVAYGPVNDNPIFANVTLDLHIGEEKVTCILVPHYVSRFLAQHLQPGIPVRVTGTVVTNDAGRVLMVAEVDSVQIREE